MSNYVNKTDKLNRFIDRVLRPARDAIEIHKGNVPAPERVNHDVSSWHREDFTPNDLVYDSAFLLPSASSLNEISPRGNLISASDLVTLFLHLSHFYSSIRKANLYTKRLTRHQYMTIRGRHIQGSVNRWMSLSEHETLGSQFMEFDKITALSADHRPLFPNFKSRIARDPNPYNALRTGGSNPSAAIDTFIDRLASVLSYYRNRNTKGITVCHSSCHMDCHHARGRR